VYDRESGQALSASFMDYAIPHIGMIRHFDMTMDESTPCRNNPMGIKGVGELGTIGATPAVVNAVVDAVARKAGVDRALTLQMPLTAETVWHALRA
jgi:aerobic carbon-monoxide dehydrogenase large subunit